MNESVWSPGTPRGLPGAFWGPRGPKKGVFGFLGAGGPGGASRLASLLALSWANRALLALFGFLCPGHKPSNHFIYPTAGPQAQEAWRSKA